MRVVKAYRLGSDDYVTYLIPSKRKAIAHLESTWGKLYNLVERREIEGGVPEAWQRTEQ